MAIIKTSGLINDIKGSINGSTFQRSAAGLIMRSKPVSVGRGTDSQQNIRQINAQLNFAWSNLTDAQRSVWASFSNFTNGAGKTNRRNNSANTGKTQYFAVNFWCLQYAKPLIVTPTFNLPEQAVIPCPPLFTSSDNLQDYVGNLDTTQQILVTRVSLPQSLSTNTANTGFRTLVYSQVGGSSQSWFNAYEAVYGIQPIPNKKYWISLQVINFITGCISPETKQLVLYTGVLPPDHGIGFMVIGSTFIVGSDISNSLEHAWNADGDANDAISTDNGTLVNGTGFTAGIIDQAFNFDGVTQYVSFDDNSFNELGDFSWNVWINPQVNPAVNGIIGNYTFPGVDRGYQILISDSGGVNCIASIVMYNEGTGVTLSQSGTIPYNAWTMLTFVRVKDTGTKIYVNGVLNNSNVSAMNPNYSPTQYATIGRVRYAAGLFQYPYKGAIDAVLLYSKALRANEITELYNSGAGMQPPF